MSGREGGKTSVTAQAGLGQMIWVDLSVPVTVRGPATAADQARIIARSIMLRPAVIFSVAMLIAGVAGMWTMNGNVSRDNEDMTDQITKLTSDTHQREMDMRKVDSLIKQKTIVEQKNAEVRRVDDNRFSMPRLMNTISGAMPASAWVTGLTVEKQDEATRNITAKIDGYAPTPADVNDIINKLNQDPFLTRAVLRSGTNVTLARQGVIKFEIGVETQIPDQTFFDVDTLRTVAGKIGNGLPVGLPGTVGPATGARPGTASSAGNGNANRPTILPKGTP